MPKRVPLKLGDGTVVGSALVVPDERGVRVEAAEIDDPAVTEALSASSADFSFWLPPESPGR